MVLQRFMGLTAMGLLVLAGAARAEITTVEPFSGELSEGFEDHPLGMFLPQIDVFGGEGIVGTTTGGAFVHVTTGWTFFGTVFPHGGNKFMGSAGDPLRWEFDTPAQKFGGYFTTNNGTNDATARFFSAENTLLGQLVVTAPANNQWVWNGWETDGVGIAAVEITGNAFNGGFIMHDDMELISIPEPAALSLIGLGALAMLRRRRTR